MPPVQNPLPRQVPPAKRANPPVASSVKKQAPLTPELLADDSALHSASAPALRPPHQAADRPAKSRKAKEADEPPPTLTDFDSAEIAPAKLVADDGVLEQSKASTIVFAMGVAGMVIGLLAGIFLAGHSIVSAYLGAAIGWASGFIFSLIFVFNADKAEVQMRCSVCRNVFSSEDEACPLCGTVPAATSFNPLAAECLSAWRYALTNIRSIVWMVLLATGLDLLIVVSQQAMHLWPDATDAGWAILGGIVLVAFLAYIFAFEYALDIITSTISRGSKLPDVPTLWPIGRLLLGLRGLILIAAYGVPIVTLPLLPLGLLTLARARQVGLLHLADVIQLIRIRSKNFVILWLMLLFWGAIMGLITTVFSLALGTGADSLYILAGVQAEAGSDPVMKIAVSAIITAILATLISFSAAILLRCVGLFGRGTESSLPSIDKLGAEKTT